MIPASEKARLENDEEPDIIYTPQYIARCLIGCAVYFVFSALFVKIAMFFPDVNTGSSAFENFYYRVVVNTTWFPLAQFVSFMALMVFGWTYVNAVTLKRWNVFTSGNKSDAAFKKMLMLSPVLFLASGLIVMRQKQDLAGYCQNANDYRHRVILQAAPEEPLNVLKGVLKADDPNVVLIHTLQTANYLRAFATPAECHVYTDDEIFNYNFWLWTAGFILLGINFSHADVGPMKHFTLTWRVMKTWGPVLWGIFICIVLVFAFLLKNEVRVLSESGVLKYYGAFLGALFAFTVWNTKRLLPQGLVLHVHHYAIGFVLAVILGYQDPLLSFAHGFACGLFVEGGCRWGYDPLWEVPQPEEDMIAESGQGGEVSKPLRTRWSVISTHQSEVRKANQAEIAQAITTQPAAARLNTYLQPVCDQITLPYLSHVQRPTLVCYEYHPEPGHQM